MATLVSFQDDAIAPALQKAHTEHLRLKDVREEVDTGGDLQREFDTVSAECNALMAIPEAAAGAGSRPEDSSASQEAGTRAGSLGAAGGPETTSGTGRRAAGAPSSGDGDEGHGRRRPRVGGGSVRSAPGARNDSQQQSPPEPRAKRLKR